MWDDPLFNPEEAEGLSKLANTDPAFLTELRRRSTLEMLDKLFQAIATRDGTIDALGAALQRTRENARENLARGNWIWKQVINHLPDEMAKRILIDLQVSRIDPDFSFCKAIGMK